jgi:hypothetical protein
MLALTRCRIVDRSNPEGVGDLEEQLIGWRGGVNVLLAEVQRQWPRSATGFSAALALRTHARSWA